MALRLIRGLGLAICAHLISEIEREQEKVLLVVGILPVLRILTRLLIIFP